MGDITLGKYEVTTGNGKVVLDLDDLIKVTRDLSEEFTRQPTVYAYVAMLAAQAETIHTEAKRLMDIAESQAQIDVRKTLLRDDERATDKRVEAEARMTKMYNEANEYELACREQYFILKAITTALEQRAQMLSQLGAHLRSEADMTGMLVSDVKKKLRMARQNAST